MIPAQDQVNEQLNQLTALLKALDEGQANPTKRKRSLLSALTTEATSLWQASQITTLLVKLYRHSGEK